MSYKQNLWAVIDADKPTKENLIEVKVSRSEAREVKRGYTGGTAQIVRYDVGEVVR